jgi:two-component system NtrC family sensor kinase
MAAPKTKKSKAPIRAVKSPKTPDDLVRFVEDLKRQWVATLDALVDPLMIVGKDYVIRKANKALARMADVDVKEVIGKKCHEAFAGRKSPCPGCKMPKAAKTDAEDGATTFTLDSIRNDRYYEVTSQPLFDLDGKPDGIVQVYRDRTEAKRMQEQLSQQEKLASIGLLAGGVAHEINNPLGGILIFSQMLLREMDKESSHYPDVVEIEAATQRCKAIVESLLDFARQNPAGKKEKAEDVNVIDAIRTAMRFGKVSLKQASLVDIQEEFDTDEQIVSGDRNKLIQLFLNLIQNAIQAMPDGGNLVIRARTQSDPTAPHGYVARYEVEDTGVGIAPEHLGKIFDPFFTTKDPGEGTGLGLALCYGIVQDLDGRMSVESTVNVGSRFIIEVPLAHPVQAAHKPAS